MYVIGVPIERHLCSHLTCPSPPKCPGAFLTLSARGSPFNRIIGGPGGLPSAEAPVLAPTGLDRGKPRPRDACAGSHEQISHVRQGS
jgi:hypothetical protein